MDEGTRYLLRVIAHYDQAIQAGRWDEVIEEIGLGLWRLDPRVGGLPRETLSLAEEMLASIHDRVMAGAYAQALSHLEGLRDYLMEIENDRRTTA